MVTFVPHRLISALSATLLLIVLLAGCTPVKTPEPKETEGATATTTTATQTIPQQLQRLLDSGAEPSALLSLLDQSQGILDRAETEKALNQLENLQNEWLPQYQALLNGDEAQRKSLETIRDLNDPEVVGRLAAPETAAVVRRIVDSGFRFEKSEDVWQPVIDYNRYLRFHSSMNPELKAYYNLLAVENVDRSVKDGALVIPLEDLSERQDMAERFLINYKDSGHRQVVGQLYQTYLKLLLTGAENTPIYQFETGDIRPDFTNTIRQYAEGHPRTPAGKACSRWLTVLERNGLKYNAGTLIPEYQVICRDALNSFGMEPAEH